MYTKIRIWAAIMLALIIVTLCGQLAVPQKASAQNNGHWETVTMVIEEHGLRVCEKADPKCKTDGREKAIATSQIKIPTVAERVTIRVTWHQTGAPDGQLNQCSTASVKNHFQKKSPMTCVPDEAGAKVGPFELVLHEDLQGQFVTLKSTHMDFNNRDPQSPGSHMVVYTLEFERWVYDPTPEPPIASSTATEAPTATATEIPTLDPSPTVTVTPTITPTSTLEPEPSETPVVSETPSPSPTGSIDQPTETAQPSPTWQPNPSATPLPTWEPVVPCSIFDQPEGSVISPSQDDYTLVASKPGCYLRLEDFSEGSNTTPLKFYITKAVYLAEFVTPSGRLGAWELSFDVSNLRDEHRGQFKKMRLLPLEGRELHRPSIMAPVQVKGR